MGSNRHPFGNSWPSLAFSRGAFPARLGQEQLHAPPLRTRKGKPQGLEILACKRIAGTQAYFQSARRKSIYRCQLGRQELRWPQPMDQCEAADPNPGSAIR